MEIPIPMTALCTITFVSVICKGNVDVYVIKITFGIFCLQFPTQNSLSEGMIPVFYHDKIPARTPGEARNAVLLSILV